MIYWRNSELDFKNPESLISSLEKKPDKKNLLRVNDSLDESVLRYFLKKVKTTYFILTILNCFGNAVKYQILKKKRMGSI